MWKKRFLALTPMIATILFVSFIPNDLLYVNETVLSLVSMLMLFISAAFALPLILRANKEMKNG